LIFPLLTKIARACGWHGVEAVTGEPPPSRRRARLEFRLLRHRIAAAIFHPLASRVAAPGGRAGAKLPRHRPAPRAAQPAEQRCAEYVIRLISDRRFYHEIAWRGDLQKS